MYSEIGYTFGARSDLLIDSKNMRYTSGSILDVVVIEATHFSFYFVNSGLSVIG